jgi:hypothetical protein
MLEDLPPAARSAAAHLLASDRRGHAFLVNLAIRADGRASAAEAVAQASDALPEPVGSELAERVLGVLLESGWAAEEQR